MGAFKTILLMIASAILGIVLFVVGVVAWLSDQASTGGTLVVADGLKQIATT